MDLINGTSQSVGVAPAQGGRRWGLGIMCTCLPHIAPVTNNRERERETVGMVVRLLANMRQDTALSSYCPDSPCPHLGYYPVGTMVRTSRTWNLYEVSKCIEGYVLTVWCLDWSSTRAFLPLLPAVTGGQGLGQLVEALRNEPEGWGFGSQWGHWNFSLTLSRLMTYICRTA